MPTIRAAWRACCRTIRPKYLGQRLSLSQPLLSLCSVERRSTLSRLASSSRFSRFPGIRLGIWHIMENGCLFCGDHPVYGWLRAICLKGRQRDARFSDALGGSTRATAVYCAHEYTEPIYVLRSLSNRQPSIARTAFDEVAVARAKGWATVPSILALEKSTNPFLRCDEAEVVATARSRSPQAAGSLAVFSVLRDGEMCSERALECSDFSSGLSDVLWKTRFRPACLAS